MMELSENAKSQSSGNQRETAPGVLFIFEIVIPISLAVCRGRYSLLRSG